MVAIIYGDFDGKDLVEFFQLNYSIDTNYRNLDEIFHHFGCYAAVVYGDYTILSLYITK